jgi:hypothetical protein
MPNKIASFGGGIGGLCAAHWLKRDSAESSMSPSSSQFRQPMARAAQSTPRPGGKARSFLDRRLPGEHGFRFFPGYYEWCRRSGRRSHTQGLPTTDSERSTSVQRRAPRPRTGGPSQYQEGNFDRYRRAMSARECRRPKLDPLIVTAVTLAVDMNETLPTQYGRARDSWCRCPDLARTWRISHSGTGAWSSGVRAGPRTSYRRVT